MDAMTHSRLDMRIWSDILRLLPAWAWEADADYRLTHVDEAMTRATGLPVERLLGLQILGEDRREAEHGAGLSTYLAALRDRRPVDSLCYERALLSGARVVLMDCAVPRWTAGGAFRGYRGITLNLSKIFDAADDSDSLVGALQSRTRALEARLSARNVELEQANHLLSEIVETMGEGLMVSSHADPDDPANVLLLANAAHRALTGIGADEMPRGMPIRDCLSLIRDRGLDLPEDADLGAALRRLGAGETVMMRMPATGRTFYTKATARPSGGYVFVHTDVTELTARNAALREARDAAEVASKAKTSFLANMSHEIRTPMNGIVGMTELLGETDLDPEQRGFVETIRNAAMALTSLISDILDVSRVEAGRLELEDSPFDVTVLLEGVFALVKPMAREKGLSLTWSMERDMPRHLVGDALRLRQVLLNLVGNAVKFTPEGWVRVVLSAEHGRLRIVVSDTGIGIPEDRQPTVFEAFEQVHTGIRRAYEGTGLGLAIARQLVGAMGGGIALVSRPDHGTTFTVDLPLKTLAGVAARSSVTEAAVRLDGRRVLVVEDNRTNQVVVQKMLERRGASVVLAENGKAALDRIGESAFDVVLMDLSMPVMSGLDATRRLRAEEARAGRPRLPVVALTGNAFARDREAALEAGCDGFLTKPVRTAALLGAIAGFVGREAAE